MAKKTCKTDRGKTTYPSDVSDEEWAFCAPYLTLMKEDAAQREHSLRRVFNAVRSMVRGSPTHQLPLSPPPPRRDVPGT
jgi:transposase